MGCLIQIQLKEVNSDDSSAVFKILSRHSELFGRKIDIVSESVLDGKPELRIYVPWDENKASEKLILVRNDKRIHKAKIIC
jgi:hypothetical protein